MKMQTLAATLVGGLILASTASAQTFIRNSGNGRGNTINASGGFGPTVLRNSGNGQFNRIRVGRGSYRPIEPQSCPSAVQRRYPRTAVGRPVFASPRRSPQQLSLGGLPPINVNVVSESGNGTGNTVNLPGGGNGLNLNLISNSGNGSGNTINVGGRFAP